MLLLETNIRVFVTMYEKKQKNICTVIMFVPLNTAVEKSVGITDRWSPYFLHSIYM